MCLLRWRGRTLVPSSTVIRDLAICPITLGGTSEGLAPAANTPWPLEAHVVHGVGVGDIDLSGHRIHRHVEQGPCQRPRSLRTCRRSSSGGLALALIANTSRSGSCRRTALFQLRWSSSCHCPACWLNLTMRLVSGPLIPSAVGVRRRQATGNAAAAAWKIARAGVAASVTDRVFAHDGGLIAGAEHCRIDGAAVRADRQCARAVTEERDDGLGSSESGYSQVRRCRRPIRRRGRCRVWSCWPSG